MTIENEILKLQTNLADSYTACNSKGATMPTDQNFDNLPDCIDSIQAGGGSFIGIPREVSANGVYGIPTTPFSFSLPSNATDLGASALYQAFRNVTTLTSVDLSSLTTMSSSNAMTNAFQGCTNLTSVNLSNLTTISGLMAATFQSGTSLASVDLYSLATVSSPSTFRSSFQGCTSLTSVNFPSLANINNSGIFNQAFSQCSSLSSLSFPSLNSSSFGSNINQFNGMLLGVTGCTVHFPSNLQSVIGSWSSVTSGFGGTNTVVLFDLPATT